MAKNPQFSNKSAINLIDIYDYDDSMSRTIPIFTTKFNPISNRIYLIISPHFYHFIIFRFSQKSLKWCKQIIRLRYRIGSSGLDQFHATLGTNKKHVNIKNKLCRKFYLLLELAVSPSNNEIHIFEKNGTTWRSLHVLREHDLLITGLDW